MLGSLLPAITRPTFHRKTTLSARLVLDWTIIVGADLASRTSPARLSAGVLTVLCVGPAAMEIQHMTTEILERIASHFGHVPAVPGRDHAVDTPALPVHRLRIVQDDGRTIRTDRTDARMGRVPPQPVPLSDFEAGDLRDALERLGGHVRASRIRR